MGSIKFESSTPKIVLGNGIIRTINGVDYQELEYLETNGQQYFDTNYIHRVDTQIHMKVKTKEISGYKSLYGCASAAGAGDILEIHTDGTTITGAFGNRSANFTDVDMEEILDIILSKDTFKVNDYVTSLGSTSTIEPTTTDIILGYRLAGTVYFISACKLYLCDIQDATGDVLYYVKKFRPYKRLSDNVVGLLDVLNDDFITNLGTGVVTAGPIKANPIYFENVKVQ